MKNMSGYSARLWIAVACGFLFLALIGYGYFKSSGDKIYRILVLHSYRQEDTWDDKFSEGIVDCFAGQRVKAVFEYAYLNCEELNVKEEEDFIRHLLDENTVNPPDLILVSDDQATYSLLVVDHPLAHQVPIIFAGVAYPNKKILDKYTNVTGFTTQPDFIKCVELIKYIYPDTKQYSLNITENLLGRTASALFLKQTASMTQSQYLVHSMGAGTVELLGKSLRVPSRRFIVPVWDSFYCELLKNYNCPYFLVDNEGFGTGPLGGYMTLSYDQGYLAAGVGIQVLKGVKIGDFPITPSPQVAAFDWRQMVRFNISPEQLPPDSRIINMPFYIRYKYLVMSVASVLLLAIAGLIVLFCHLYLVEKRKKKQAFFRLKDHKNMLNIALKSIREGVISIDKDFNIFAINRAALEWLGLESDSSLYVGKNIEMLLNITTPTDKYYLHTMLSRLFTEHRDTQFEVDTLIQSLGIRRIFSAGGELSGIYQDGELYGAVIAFHDITQEIIRNKFISLSMSTGNVFSWQYNKRTEMFTFDQSFFRQFDLPVPDNRQIGFMEIKSLVYPEDIEILMKTIEEIRSGNTRRITRQIRVNLFGKGYTWWEFRLTVMPAYVYEAEYLISGLLFNIQSFKEIEEELVRSYTKAEQSEKLKSAFLANMSHEIRTPLNGIVGFSNLLTSGEEFEPEETILFIETIRKNCDLLLALITDILNLASIESNIVTFKFVPCDVNALIEQIVTTQRVIVPAHLRLISQIPEHTVTLMTDPLRLNQVLTNLVNNATKFTSKGSITIGYTTEEPGFLNFFVEDTGKGIAPEDLDSVFVRFFKKDDFAQGAGLGLSICTMIVKRFHGTISVSSELGVGTRFTVRIPTEQITS